MQDLLANLVPPIIYYIIVQSYFEKYPARSTAHLAAGCFIVNIGVLVLSMIVFVSFEVSGRLFAGLLAFAGFITYLNLKKSFQLPQNVPPVDLPRDPQSPTESLSIPPPAPTNVVRSDSKHLTVIIIVLLILVLVFAFIYRLTSSTSPTTITKTNEKALPSEPRIVVKGKLYRNAIYNFQIVFPEGWTVKESSQFGRQIIATDPSATRTVTIAVIDLPPDADLSINSMTDEGVKTFADLFVEGLKAAPKIKAVSLDSFGLAQIHDSAAVWATLKAYSNDGHVFGVRVVQVIKGRYMFQVISSAQANLFLAALSEFKAIEETIRFQGQSGK